MFTIIGAIALLEVAGEAIADMLGYVLGRSHQVRYLTSDRDVRYRYVRPNLLNANAIAWSRGRGDRF